MKPNFKKELDDLVNQIYKAWDENNVNSFINTTHRINLLFTTKIQVLLDGKNITYTFDLKSKEAEANLMKLNTVLDQTLAKKNELVAQLEVIDHLENKIKRRQDEGFDSSGK